MNRFAMIILKSKLWTWKYVTSILAAQGIVALIQVFGSFLRR